MTTRETYDNNGNLIATETLEIDVVAVASERIARSDIVALRCVKAGVPFPSEWQTYIAELRGIVSAGTGTLPDQPAYPSGT